jgi:hypothetical protein
METKDRYQLIVLAKNPSEISFRNDAVRQSGEETALHRHRLIQTFVEHFHPERLLYVEGERNDRVEQVANKVLEMRLSPSS